MTTLSIPVDCGNCLGPDCARCLGTGIVWRQWAVCNACPELVLPAEADLSERAYGVVLCGACRAARYGPRLEERIA